jgi:RHS repeat-associated protein
LSDHQGTVRDLLNAAGAIINHVDYSAFGVVLAQSNASVGDRFLYTGREYDANLALYWYRARWYDASSGRFTSVDPLLFGAGDAFNPYRYVGNAPANGTDPSGMVTEQSIFNRAFVGNLVRLIQRVKETVITTVAPGAYAITRTIGTVLPVVGKVVTILVSVAAGLVLTDSIAQTKLIQTAQETVIKAINQAVKTVARILRRIKPKCEVSSVQLFAPIIPTFIPLPKFGPIGHLNPLGNGDLNMLGPHLDPRGIGEFRNVHWVVWSGKHLNLCLFSRHKTLTDARRFTTDNQGTRGFLGEMGLANAADFPDNAIHDRYVSDTLVVLADAPGFPFVTGPQPHRDGFPGEYPVSAKFNFYQQAVSLQDKEIKGQIWYHTVIEAVAPGPSGSRSNYTLLNAKLSAL